MELRGIGESLLGRPPAPKGHSPLHAEDTKYIFIGLRWLLVEWLSSLCKFCSGFWRVIALRLNACHHLRPSSLTWGPCSLLPQWLCTCSSCEALLFSTFLCFLQYQLNDSLFGKLPPVFSQCQSQLHRLILWFSWSHCLHCRREEGGFFFLFWLHHTACGC